MTPVVVSPRADADVDAMLEHLADLAGPAVARRYSQELDVYDYEDNTVVIVRVLDERRNIARRLVRQ
jgi:plasmid stabilization system protein ParE